MYRSVMEAGAKALIDRYSKNDLSTVELLRRCLEDDTMTDEDITTLAEYYNGDINLGQLLYEINNWFTRCKGMCKETNISTLRKTFAEKESLKFHCVLCVIYVYQPVTTCEAERAFSMLSRIHTYLRNSQTQQRLNHFSVLAAHRDVARMLDMCPIINEFIDSTTQRVNIFGHPAK